MPKFTLQQQFRRLNGRTLGRRQVEASYVFGVGLRLAQYGGHLHFYDFL
jgi:hypothetical protein